MSLNAIASLLVTLFLLEACGQSTTSEVSVDPFTQWPSGLKSTDKLVVTFTKVKKGSLTDGVGGVELFVQGHYKARCVGDRYAEVKRIIPIFDGMTSFGTTASFAIENEADGAEEFSPNLKFSTPVKLFNDALANRTSCDSTQLDLMFTLDEADVISSDTVVRDFMFHDKWKTFVSSSRHLTTFMLLDKKSLASAEVELSIESDPAAR